VCVHIYIFNCGSIRRSLDVSFAATSIHRMFTRTRTNSRWDGRLVKASERTIHPRKAIDSKDGIYLAVGGFFEIALLPVWDATGNI